MSHDDRPGSGVEEEEGSAVVGDSVKWGPAGASPG